MNIVCHVGSCAYKKKNNECLLKNIALDENSNCLYRRNVDINKIQPFEHCNFHSNEYTRPDGDRCNKGVYCRMQHKIIKNLYESPCPCPLLSGGAQGNGIECFWDDVALEWGGFFDPMAELLRVSHLIEIGILDRNPSREGKVYNADDFIPENK